ncbi:MAG TPA: VTT domain-containing protein [Candidatus Methylomirabilis sp.]|nr:VTT domain-containing protein [Candidatus Methylomirabilis sp.]
MAHVLGFVARYGQPLVFAWVLADQGGLPIPAIPLLLVAGALIAAGRLSVFAVVPLAVAGCLAADLIWYGFGWARGHRVLGIMCRITLEPDSCVRRVEDLFMAQRLRSLVFAKFLPGLNPLAAALSGVVKTPLGRFLAADAGGALVWVGTWTGLGYAFSDLIEQIAAMASRLGAISGVILVGALGVYISVRFVLRRRFMRKLRAARISAADLKARLDANQPTVIVDLRTPVDVKDSPYVIPGALRISPEELERRAEEIPRNTEIVLYCT